jgi:DNA-binding FadR family transcriptional regulator
MHPCIVKYRLKTASYTGGMTSPGPDQFASRRLADALRAEIRDGTYPPGARMPSYRQLRDVHHVAQNTAQAAIRLLAAEGLVEIRPARGAYVRETIHAAGNSDLQAELASLQATLRRSRQELTEAENAIASLLARHFTGEHAD